MQAKLLRVLEEGVFERLGSKVGKLIESIGKKSMAAMVSYSWPGNVRELRNVIERAMILSRAGTFEVTPPRIAGSDNSPDQSLVEVERRHIISWKPQ